MAKEKFEGFIFIHRKFKNWEWYNKPATRLIFEHCLYSANFKDEIWKGKIIKRGQFPTSVEKLAIANGLSIQQTRTALSNLKTTNEINIQTTNRYSLITVKNWDLYQPNQQTNQQINNMQTNKQINNTIINNNKDNKVNNIIKEEEEERNFSEKNDFENIPLNEMDAEAYKIESENWRGTYNNVHLTEKQYQKLQALILSKEKTDEIINDFSENIASNQGKAKPYDEAFPDMHFIVCKKYWEYRRKYPERFNPNLSRRESKEDIARENMRLVEEWMEKYNEDEQ